MIDNFKKLVRPNIQKLQPYESARRIGGQHGDVLLNANESPIFTPFELKKKIFNRYPECQPSDLISSYSEYAGVLPEQILATRGADEGIELLIKAFCDPGKDSIIYCPPTYDMYKINAKIAGITIKEVPSIKNTWQLDLFNIQLNLKNVKLLYICHPNNPTGNIISKGDLISLLEMTENRALIILDEAYIEFIPEKSMIFYLKKYSNLVILRTLSKAFALAGIRCGFILAHKEIIHILNKVISPYPISIPVSNIAIQSLSQRFIQIMKNRVSELNDNRIWLINELKQLSCVKKIFNSHTNYILVRFFMFEEIFNTFWKKGIILRKQNSKMNLEQCLRITIGTRAECFRVIQELKTFSAAFSKRGLA
ncbi:histidinol-phosphate transaminase [Buchnera aphidicola (Hyadaphis tataricae)]|uniref:Histidinol-phosphate aminotransferase n=1 Tax=Buchnera aphidicola (Hyadaphis tataricae) TaxID=1241859 RepID=A0A4D6Y5Y7_9GAMM|nr:histidinol-phosphate transaminase [Buchnera aphidicola]QCI21421.1 histidinol-phosphate transaminase [Buchnera aphidicola (Hyadaphis tataricae)]